MEVEVDSFSRRELKNEFVSVWDGEEEEGVYIFCSALRNEVYFLWWMNSIFL